jgi:hypothetical protein
MRLRMCAKQARPGNITLRNTLLEAGCMGITVGPESVALGVSESMSEADSRRYVRLAPGQGPIFAVERGVGVPGPPELDHRSVEHDVHVELPRPGHPACTPFLGQPTVALPVLS